MTSYWSILVIIEVQYLGVHHMNDVGRVITAKLPDELVSQMDVIADRLERSKSWIVREAVASGSSRSSGVMI